MPSPHLSVMYVGDIQEKAIAYIFFFWRDSGDRLKGQISCLFEQSSWLYALIALQQSTLKVWIQLITGGAQDA